MSFGRAFKVIGEVLVKGLCLWILVFKAGSPIGVGDDVLSTRG